MELTLKIKEDFVTNSSSTSYYVYFPKNIDLEYLLRPTERLDIWARQEETAKTWAKFNDEEYNPNEPTEKDPTKYPCIASNHCMTDECFKATDEDFDGKFCSDCEDLGEEIMYCQGVECSDFWNCAGKFKPTRMNKLTKKTVLQELETIQNSAVYQVPANIHTREVLTILETWGFFASQGVFEFEGSHTTIINLAVQKIAENAIAVKEQITPENFMIKEDE